MATPCLGRNGASSADFAGGHLIEVCGDGTVVVVVHALDLESDDYLFVFVETRNVETALFVALCRLLGFMAVSHERRGRRLTLAPFVKRPDGLEG